jgi:hypothetical protein
VAAPQALPLQSESAQSTLPSQSSSTPSEQLVSVAPVGVQIAWQTPPVQRCPPPQAGLPPHLQMPELHESLLPVQSPFTQQLALGMHVVPQTFCPETQVQAPTLQICVPGQAEPLPHLQVLVAVSQVSVLPVQSELEQQLATGMHPVPQGFWPAGQTQVPPVQTGLGPGPVQAGMVPHRQVWVAASQVSVRPVHSVLAQQPATGMHRAPQTFWPVGHLQAAPLQLCGPVHAGAAPHRQEPAVQVSPAAAQSAAVQQLAVGTQPAPHAFWPVGQTHTPLWQVLPVPQAVPSPATACAQPVEGSQLSTVHGSVSAQSTAVPPAQLPAPSHFLPVKQRSSLQPVPEDLGA